MRYIMSKSIKRFLRSDEGSIAPMAAMLIVVMVMMIGGFVDFGMASIVRNKMSSAIDSAGLAAAAAPKSQEKKDVAQRYYELNYPTNFMGITMPFENIVYSYDDKTNQLQLNSDPKVAFSTYFLKVSNVQSIPLTSGALVQAEITSSEMQDEDYALIIDISSSMKTKDMQNNTKTRMQAVQEASAGLVAKLLPYQSSNPAFNPNVRIGLVEFDGKLDKKMAITSNNKTINDAISAIKIGSGTCGACGLMGAKELYSGSPSPQTSRQDSQMYSNSKNVILLTDGEFNKQYSKTMGKIEEEAHTICSGIKSNNITIYTIGFSDDLTTNTKAQKILNDCASKDVNGNSYFYLAPDMDKLIEAFQTIILVSTKTRIVR